MKKYNFEIDGKKFEVEVNLKNSDVAEVKVNNKNPATNHITNPLGSSNILIKPSNINLISSNLSPYYYH